MLRISQYAHCQASVAGFPKSKVVERSESDNVTIVKQMLQVFPCPRSLAFSQCVISVSSQVAKRSKSVCQ